MKTLLSRIRFALRRLANRTATETDLNDELQSYLEHETNAKIRSGLEPREARRQASAEFGGVEQVKEIVRDYRAGSWIDNLLRDFRYAIRSLIHSRTFSLSVIGSLSLGIAVTVTAFAFINALMFRPFPGVERQEELTEVSVARGCEQKRPCWFPTPDDYAALRGGLTGFTSFTGFAVSNVVYEARLVQAVFVLPGYFETLGAHPVIGRALNSEDAGGVVIANAFWKSNLNSDPSVLGKSIRIGPRLMKIVGVAPPDFRGLSLPAFGSGSSEFWLPIAAGPELSNWTPVPPYLHFIGRSQPGTSLPTIRAEAEVVFSHVAAARGMVTTPGRADFLVVSGFDPAKRPLAIAIVMLVPVLVLMVSCVNAANMLFGRAAVRDREIAIRLSIGASRGRVACQLLIESVVLSIAAAVVSVPLASIALNLASRNVVDLAMPIDTQVIAGTLVTAFLCAVGFGLTPAIRMTSVSPGRALSSTGNPRQIQIKRTLIIGQIALSLALLAVGTQLVASLLALGGSAGIAAERLLLATFNLDQIRMSPEEADRFYDRLADRVAKIPQVEAAGVGPALWFFGGRVIKTSDINRLRAWKLDAPPTDDKGPGGGTADPGMFQAVGIPLVEGRWFNDEDRRQPIPKVAIVNRAFAARVLEGPAVGRVIRLAGRDQDYTSSVEVTIVGMVENLAEPRNDRRGARSFVYTPARLGSEAARVLYVRSRGPVGSLSSAVASAVRELDPRVPIGTIGSLDDFNYQSLPEARLAQGAKAFGYVALVLAMFGMFGVMSYFVSQRSREIAVRMALGAEAGNILRMVLKQAMTLASVGAIIGGVLAVIASLALQVFNRAPLGIHRAAFAGSALLLLAAMLLGGAIPAIRASRVDPVDNLRQS